MCWSIGYPSSAKSIAWMTEVPSLSQKISAAMKDRALRALGLDLKSEYITTEPDPQQTLNLFAGEWASRLPAPLDHLTAGEANLFDDARIKWLASQLGNVNGLKVLECGPLEGGHTYMLERLGAASIRAIEASTRAFLRCLVVKELLRTERSEFVLGDFVSEFRTSNVRYDLVLACGVLYHLVDPAEAIALMSRRTDQIYIWTHYYDSDVIRSHPKLSHHFSGVERREFDGLSYSLYRQNYQSRLGNPGFMGGAERFSNWLSREDLLACLSALGYSRITVHFDEPRHAAGPNISLLAQR